MDLLRLEKLISDAEHLDMGDMAADGVTVFMVWQKEMREAIAAVQVGGERKWPDTICNDIDKLLRQHIRWTQGDHSEGTYIEGWRKAARAVEEYIQKMQRAPAPVAVTAASVKRILLDTLEVQVRPNDPKDVPGISDDSLNEAADAIIAALAAEVG